MAPKLDWLSTCKAAQLKAIASATGIHSSGTKPILIARLEQELLLRPFALADFSNGKSKTRSAPHNILSIDMGIRNLAYCRFTLPSNWSITTNSPWAPTITEWTRIAISSKHPPASPQSKEAFDPATYARHAHTLISSLLRQPPSQILIERQRFRSMGGAAVQEWTLRVNMFEAMLYAVLHTYAARHLWRGAVHPVAPGKVAKFWLGDAEPPEEDARRKRGSVQARSKTAKIELVERWLGQGDRFLLQGSAARMAGLYLERRRGEKRTRLKGRKSVRESGANIAGMAEGIAMDPPESAREGIGKLDDLADCLLQGMAWIKWEQNRIAILAHGADAVDELETC